MRKKVISGLKYGAFLLLGIILLWLLFSKIDLQEALTQFRKANYWWILLSWVFSVLSHIARAIRWNILIQSLGYQPRTLTTFYAVMSGYLTNMVLPRVGEIARCGLLGRKEKIPVNGLLGSVVAERVFDMVFLLLLIFLVIIFQLEFVGKFVEQQVFTPVYDQFADHGIMIVSVFILVVVVSIILYRVFIPYLRKLAYFEKIRDFLIGFLNGIRTIQRLRRRGAFLFWTLVIWLNYLLMTYVVFFAIEATSHLTFVDALTVLAIGSLGMVAPVPGGLGTYHFFVTLILFELFAVPKAAALTWATIMHASQGVLIFIVGLFSYFMIFTQKSKIHEPPANHKI